MMAVDQKCIDLAEHFLGDIKGRRPEDVTELAEEIQRRCEDACSAIEEDEAAYVRQGTHRDAAS